MTGYEKSPDYGGSPPRWREALWIVAAFVFIAGALYACNAIADPLPVCKGGHRAERKLTCVYDGDGGWENGVKWRLTRRDGGVDAPELFDPSCGEEYRLAILSRDRLRALMSEGYTVLWLGRVGGKGRSLAWIGLKDGRDVGQTLIDEGLAQVWPNFGNLWCP
ncbi:thermonuclease family protein [Notoacmeibacter ruber]|uniref:Thermonuclease family protein n=1 Tax=Notoacmeibacter ruber TaxID=2670375 RepID=A0A3L7JF42_9HYPH|nr:hypothetical protein [Notoacmeibacter ruber]RLQ87092.1 hypothetical protein D8780_01555 [Notoacmeibacter ruber]